MGTTRMRVRIVPIILIIINVIVFFLEMKNENILAMGAVNASSVFQDGQWYRLITSMFMHGGIEHILYNMVSLYFLSDIMLTFIRNGKYVAIYMGSGLLGGLLSIGATQLLNLPDIWSVGASGAIMGLVGANIVLLLKAKKEGIQSGALIIRLVIAGLINVIPTSSGIDYSAHICGLIVGAIMAFFLVNKIELE